LKEFKKYPESTVICLNSALEGGKTVVDVAKTIYQEGYFNIYLLVSTLDPKYLQRIGAPDYLQILCTDNYGAAINKLLGRDD
jgi:hypothetical protein